MRRPLPLWFAQRLTTSKVEVACQRSAPGRRVGEYHVERRPQFRVLQLRHHPLDRVDLPTEMPEQVMHLARGPADCLDLRGMRGSAFGQVMHFAGDGMDRSPDSIM